MSDLITQSRLKEIVSYCPETGQFLRLVGGEGFRAGPLGKKPDVRGYIVFRLDGREYKAHRLAWLYMTGKWPDQFIDHADGNKANNAFCNLREADWSQNKANERRRKDNLSGFKGAKPHPNGKWQARIQVNGVRKSLGYHATPRDAHEAYMQAARMFFGEFARAG